MENTDTSLVCEQNQRQWKKKAHGFGLWGVLRVFCLLGDFSEAEGCVEGCLQE